MMRTLSVAVSMCGFVLAGLASSGSLFGQANTSDTQANAMFAWTYRTGTNVDDRAIAFRVENGLDGRLSWYRCLSDGEGGRSFEKVDLTITDPSASTSTERTVRFKLAPVSNGYAIRYVRPDGAETAIDLGWVRMHTRPGKQRAILIRWNAAVIRDSSGMFAVSSGCDEPPADDVGEEELIPESSPGSGSPGRFLGLDPGAAPPPPPPPSSAE